MKDIYTVSLEEQNKSLVGLANRHDVEAERIKRYLSMADLSRLSGSPLNEIVEKVKSLPVFSDFDNIIIPEIIPTSIIFDLFGFAVDHPARSKSDTYYVDDKNVLRTHDTVFWYYYFNLPEIQEKIKRQETLGVLCYGKVYRKDEIDRKHMNIFHQMGGLYLVPDSQETVSFEELKKVLVEIVQSIFGAETKYRFVEETFPYTNPSIEVEVEINGEWYEIVGSGMPKKEVLANFGLTGYNGWAFGFGLERLAIIGMELPDIRLLWSDDERVKKQLRLGNKYKEVSKFPPVVRDVSFVVGKDFVLNDYFDAIRDLGGELVEEVHLLDKYENAEKFGEGKISYTFRITYRSLQRTLTNAEVNVLHEKIEEMTKKDFNGVIRIG
jgi:phenylalanyl-tRNA synthetase alpha chain